MPDHFKSNGQPLITVGMPIYNAGTDLRLAVLSIVKQTFSDWELLIIDDGSTDSALQSIADICDHRIKILRDGMNKGLAARLNEAVDLARGKYFARMDQDDASYPTRFERQVELLQKNPQLDLAATRAITIDDKNTAFGEFPYAISHNEICALPWRGFHFPHPTWMGKTEWFRKHRYTVPGPYFCEDQELLLRSHRESQFCTVDEVLYAYRIKHSINFLKLAKTRWTVFAIQAGYFFDINQRHLVFLSALVLFRRFSMDVMKSIGGVMFMYPLKTISIANKKQWLDILDGLSDKPPIL
jgi:glycosyltransferase involved in cell wall biosynthesis